MLLDGHQRDDWGIKGNAGIFSLGIGPWATEAAWVDTNASWGSWLGPNTVNRFGLWLYSGDGISDITHIDYADYKHFNHFRTLGTWGEPFSVGMALGDNFKFTLGHMFTGWDPTGDNFNPKDNKSSVNGTFMLSGSPVDMINFDLFYAIQGKNDNTLSLPVNDFGYNPPSAKWLNNVGAYVQIKGIENLAISVGYSGWFNIYEAGSFVPDTGLRDAKPVKFKAPLTSGVDLRIGFYGIDKIPLKFNNNVSFASVKGEKVDPEKYQDSVVLGFGGNNSATAILTEGKTQDWFTWTSTLRAELGFIEGVGLEVAFGNIYSQAGTTTDTSDTQDLGAGIGSITTKVDGSTKQTFNEFKAVVGAKYGVGNVNLGIALSLGIASRSLDQKSTTTTSSTILGTSSTTTVEKTSNKVDTVVTFGVPIYFQVSF